MKALFRRYLIWNVTRAEANHVKRFVHWEQMPLPTSEYLQESNHSQSN